MNKYYKLVEVPENEVNAHVPHVVLGEDAVKTGIVDYTLYSNDGTVAVCNLSSLLLEQPEKEPVVEPVGELVEKSVVE